MVRQLARIGRRQAHFEMQRLLAGPRQDQVNLDLRMGAQALEQPHAVDHAARAGDADDDLQARIIARWGASFRLAIRRACFGPGVMPARLPAWRAGGSLYNFLSSS